MQAFLNNNHTVIVIGNLQDGNGTTIGAALDVFTTDASGAVDKALRFHLPPFAPDWTSSDHFEVTHSSPTEKGPYYHRNPPFQIAGDQSIVLVGIKLTKGEKSCLVQFLVSSDQTLLCQHENLFS